MAASSDDHAPRESNPPAESLAERIKKEIARVRRLALLRRKLILEELAAIEGEYDLPRTKPARH